MNRKNLCDEVQKYLSAARLDEYKEPEDTDYFNATAQYLWNTALCEALYPAMQSFKVALRNAIYESVRIPLGDNWLQTERNFRKNEWERVISAKDSLTKLGKVDSRGNLNNHLLISELTFGFWTGLFAREYDKSIVAPTFRRGLRNFPKNLKVRQTAYDKFERARYLRNRVFHHDRIYYWKDLPQRHRDIINYLGYISNTNRDLITLIDRFDSVYTLGWKHYRTQIGNEILSSD